MDISPRTMDSSSINYQRQRDLLPESSIRRVSLVGAGSVGSFTALILAKMGIPLEIWDHDFLESHNIPNQLYPTSAIGKSKVQALSEFLWDFAEVKPIIHPVEFKRKTITQIIDPILVLTIDTMRARKEIWEAALTSDKIRYFLDCRVGAQFIRIFSVPIQEESFRDRFCNYAKTLYSDEEAFEDPCSARSIMYTPAIAGGLIGGLIAKYFRREGIPEQVMMMIPALHVEHSDWIPYQIFTGES